MLDAYVLHCLLQAALAQKGCQLQLCVTAQALFVTLQQSTSADSEAFMFSNVTL